MGTQSYRAKLSSKNCCNSADISDKVLFARISSLWHVLESPLEAGGARTGDIGEDDAAGASSSLGPAITDAYGPAAAGSITVLGLGC